MCIYVRHHVANGGSSSDGVSRCSLFFFSSGLIVYFSRAVLFEFDAFQVVVVC